MKLKIKFDKVLGVFNKVFLMKVDFVIMTKLVDQNPMSLI